MSKLTVDMYEVPHGIYNLARRRTANIRAAWGRWGDYTLTMLCQSCYLQGIEDANQAIESTKDSHES